MNTPGEDDLHLATINSPISVAPVITPTYSTPCLNDSLTYAINSSSEDTDQHVMKKETPCVLSPLPEATLPTEVNIPGLKDLDGAVGGVCDSQINSSVDSDSDDVCDPITPTGCFNNECSYGGGPGSKTTGIGLYICRKCDVEVCIECYTEGTAHSGHRKYLRKK